MQIPRDKLPLTTNVSIVSVSTSPSPARLYPSFSIRRRHLKFRVFRMKIISRFRFCSYKLNGMSMKNPALSLYLGQVLPPNSVDMHVLHWLGPGVTTPGWNINCLFLHPKPVLYRSIIDLPEYLPPTVGYYQVQVGIPTYRNITRSCY